MLNPATVSSHVHNGSADSRGERVQRPAAHTGRDSARGDYTVREGDTLSRIAERHGTTWQRLYAANEAVIGDDPNLIVPGQRLAL